MSYYKDTFLKELREKKERRERGEFNGIPLCYTNYSNYIGSIDKGVYYGLFSGTGNAKSYWMRHTFIYEPLRFSMETGYKIKILYFALEDSQMQVYKKICAHYLWIRHKIIISQKLLDSKEEPLPDRYLAILEEDGDFYEFFEENVFIFNDDLDPDAILERCEEYNNKYGEENHMIAIIDNYANITRGNYSTEYEAIATLSREHIRLNLIKKLNFSVLAIMQSDQDSEKHAARNSGGNISSIEPNLGSIGKIKIVAQDMHVIWALFNPWRYEIPSYPRAKAGWNTECLRDRFRALIMLKNNLEAMAPRLGLYFEGSKGVFTELPSITEEDKLQRIYAQVIEDERKFKQSRSNQ